MKPKDEEAANEGSNGRLACLGRSVLSLGPGVGLVGH